MFTGVINSRGMLGEHEKKEARDLHAFPAAFDECKENKHLDRPKIITKRSFKQTFSIVIS